jgi:ubiquinone/menaquinone biosynthesis C-methylase UbiE
MTPAVPPAADVETSSDAYARRFAGEVGAWFLDVQARHTLELLSPWPAARVLEVGGGHGQLTGPLVASGYDVTVVGSDPACRHRVREWVDAGRARFETADLARLPYPDRAFTAALSYRLLPHVDDWRGLLRELCRVAERAVVVDYPTTRSVNAVSAPLFGMKKGVEGDTRPFTVLRDHEVEEAFAAGGFRVTARRGQFVFPMALHRAMGRAGVSRAVEAAARTVGLDGLLGSPVILRAERA